MDDSGEKHTLGGLTTSAHSAWQADNTFRGWTPSSSAAPHTLAHKPTHKHARAHTERKNNELLVVGRQNKTIKRRRTSPKPVSPELRNSGLCDVCLTDCMLSYTSTAEGIYVCICVHM